MLKRMKTVIMMLFLMGAITGTANASPTLTNADNVRITQQTGNCSGTVKDATGEPVIGASVVIKGPPPVQSQTLTAISLCLTQRKATSSKYRLWVL